MTAAPSLVPGFDWPPPILGELREIFRLRPKVPLSDVGAGFPVLSVARYPDGAVFRHGIIFGEGDGLVVHGASLPRELIEIQAAYNFLRLIAVKHRGGMRPFCQVTGRPITGDRIVRDMLSKQRIEQQLEHFKAGCPWADPGENEIWILALEWVLGDEEHRKAYDELIRNLLELTREPAETQTTSELVTRIGLVRALKQLV